MSLLTKKKRIAPTVDSSTKQPMTPAERKRAQRERDMAQGYIEITVKVPVDRIEEAREWCSKLKPRRKPRKASNAAQIDMFEGAAA